MNIILLYFANLIAQWGNSQKYRQQLIYISFSIAMHILPCYVSSCHHPSRAAVVLKSFMLPLITIISSTAGDESQERCQKMAKNLLINVQNHTKNHHQAFEMVSCYCFYFMDLHWCSGCGMLLHLRDVSLGVCHN